MPRNTIIAIVAAILIVVALVIWFVTSQDKEQPTPVLSVSAFNQTKNVAADSTAAAPDDVIVYTLVAENQTDDTITGYVVEANISEITNKATLIDASGASYNAATNSLVWTPLDISAHDQISKQFSVRVNPLPVGTTGDELGIRFNNELKVSVSAPAVVAGNSNGKPDPYVAPPTGTKEWLPALFAVIATVLIAFRRKLVGITTA